MSPCPARAGRDRHYYLLAVPQDSGWPSSASLGRTGRLDLLGLGPAVDYGLLMINRFREARAAGAGVPAAVEHTVATAGRTITFSALTVATALSGLSVFTEPTFTSVAAAGIATVLIALAAAPTVIPALLGAWGAKLKAAARQNAEDGLFGRLARRVQARPWLAALGVAGLLAAAGLPFLHAHYGLGDPRTLPASSQSRQVSQAHWPSPSPWTPPWSAASWSPRP